MKKRYFITIEIAHIAENNDEAAIKEADRICKKFANARIVGLAKHTPNSLIVEEIEI